MGKLLIIIRDYYYLYNSKELDNEYAKKESLERVFGFVMLFFANFIIIMAKIHWHYNLNIVTKKTLEIVGENILTKLFAGILFIAAPSILITKFWVKPYLAKYPVDIECKKSSYTLKKWVTIFAFIINSFFMLLLFSIGTR